MRTAKQFQFDTRTGLLHKVVYRTFRAGRVVAVEVEYRDYSEVTGQRVAQHVVRREDGLVVADIQLRTIQIIAKQSDNAFSGQ